MTRKIAAGCFAAAFGLAVSAGAQTPSPSTPQTPPSTPSTPSSPYPSAQSPTSERGGKETKLTGCVAAGTGANSFELTNVKKGGSASDPASPSSSPSSSPSASAGGASSSAPVKLVAAAGTDLATHVGHTVEVSGSWAKSSDSPSSPSATPPSASGSSASGGKEFNVTAVKMVSSTCTAGTN